jgi:hypothetical protein
MILWSVDMFLFLFLSFFFFIVSVLCTKKIQIRSRNRVLFFTLQYLWIYIQKKEVKNKSNRLHKYICMFIVCNNNFYEKLSAIMTASIQRHWIEENITQRDKRPSWQNLIIDSWFLLIKNNTCSLVTATCHRVKYKHKKLWWILAIDKWWKTHRNDLRDKYLSRIITLLIKYVKKKPYCF